MFTYRVPTVIGWAELDGRLRRRGVVVGGNYYGPLSGKVFRVGHTGTQVLEVLVGQALTAPREALAGE